METAQMIGIALVVMGVMDAAMGRFVVVPKVQDERQRAMLNMAFFTSGALMILLGVAFLAGVVPLE